MTCIVGLIDKGKVYMGGDSAALSGYDINLSVHPKVFRNGPFLMGYTSSFRMGQLLQHALHAPERGVGQDVYAYMVTTFVDAVRQCLKDGGYARKHDEGEEGGTFLVAYAGRLFMIADDYQVHEAVGSYHAVGCGADYALGSMRVTASTKPKQRIRMALETAAHFSAGVAGPFTILARATPQA
jgi:ATP-dependent protease HslVU (ClpYQ) peptidase subunit